MALCRLLLRQVASTVITKAHNKDRIGMVAIGFFENPRRMVGCQEQIDKSCLLLSVFHNHKVRKKYY